MVVSEVREERREPSENIERKLVGSDRAIPLAFRRERETSSSSKLIRMITEEEPHDEYFLQNKVRLLS